METDTRPIQATRPERNAQLDGLRGYAAFVVAIYHVITGTEPSLITRILPVTIQSLRDGYDLIQIGRAHV